MEESANGDEKAPKAENVQDAPCQDSRVYSISWTINQERNDRVSFVGCGVVGQSSHRVLQIYDFSLQILFQEIEIGHL